MNPNVQLEDHNDVIEMKHIQHSGCRLSSSDTPKQSKWLSNVYKKGRWYIQALFEETVMTIATAIRTSIDSDTRPSSEQLAM